MLVRSAMIFAGFGARSIGSASSMYGTSTHVGGIFEREARDVLNSVRAKIFPWATSVTYFISRDDVTDSSSAHRQFDLFGYADGDNGMSCKDDPTAGVKVVQQAALQPSRDTVREKPAPADMVVSSRGQSSPLDDNATRKHVVGELYSGCDEETEAEKCNQLETLLAFLLQRHNDRTGSKITDITDILGAAVLVFAAQTIRVSSTTWTAQQERAVSLVQLNSGPNMKRLISSGRLVVAALKSEQVPSTAAERDNFAALMSIKADLEELKHALLPQATPFGAEAHSSYGAHSGGRPLIDSATYHAAASGSKRLRATSGQRKSDEQSPAVCASATCNRPASVHCSNSYCGVCCRACSASGRCTFHLHS